MSKKFHIVPIKLAEGQKFDKATNTLTLSNAGPFNFTIKEYQDEFKALDTAYKTKESNTAFQNKVNKSLQPGSDAYIDYQKKKEIATREVESLKNSRDKLYEKYADLQWCWQLFGNEIQDSSTLSHNKSLKTGIQDFTLDVNGNKEYGTITFNKLLEGGGYIWLEVFTNDDPATGKATDGIFVRAMGKPQIIRTQWTDFDYKPLTQTIGFGSKVLLNIYTQGLYGQELDVNLYDRDKADPNDTLATRIIAEVNTYKLHPNEVGKEGVSGTITNKTETEVKENRTQKAVLEVTINPSWQFTAGKHLSIFPTILHEETREEFTIENNHYLDVQLNSPVQKDPQDTGNKPLMIGQIDTSARENVNDNKKTIDFTFGVIIDGTLNNLYNSEARQKFEEKHGVAKSQKQVKKTGEEKYRYIDESSYENDLSNPAIIYKNYIQDEYNPNHPVFVIYTEGIGTKTKPNEQGTLEAEDYKNDDMIGYGLGTTAIFSNTGIKKKVRQACEEIAKKITEVIGKKPDYVVGTITVDVFGFSRGAAAARNFVHEITHHAYHASYGIESYRCDQHGYTVAPKYFENTLLPKNGHLGYMLAEGNVTFKKLNIRFAGLYDTVPHHGLSQANDAHDLGLHSIDKADYVVHMAAADEHRKNFSLVGIKTVNKTPPQSGKKGGIELFLPGVHCDVGGSYVDEKPENKTRIDALFDYHELKKLKKELVAQGWFTSKQLYILGDGVEVDDTNYKSQIIKLLLNSRRKNVSNQYSFIPLHIMVEFCEMKNVVLNKDNISRIYKFTDKGHIKGNVKFLDRIKLRLHAYAFDGAAQFSYQEPNTFTQPDIVYDPKHATKAIADYNARQEEGQKQEDALADIKNTDIKFLRNNHLHWNSVYGQQGLDIATQPHAPGIDENNKRKRTVR
uniref:T6SS phospholipase effector Tle1-like catalytic domain-containing protein n=2 Tax=Flavobacterium sp. TaxID=239 RepID=UPI0040481A86